MKPTLRIGDWDVDPVDGQIRRGDEVRRLRPKAMGVLCCLADADNELVERDEIINQVWGRDLVTDEPLTTCIAELRRGLDDRATSPRYIQTVPKRGYRLVAEASRIEDLSAMTSAGTEADAATLSVIPATNRYIRRSPALLVIAAIIAVGLFLIVDKPVPQIKPPAPQPTAMTPAETPAIAVLPFLNMSSDTENDYFGDAIAEEILNSLTRVDGIRVRSRTSSFALKNQNIEMSQIAARLKVSHILEGSVRRSGDKLRINAQLIDVEADTHVWSDVFEKNPQNVFEIQGEIATRVSESLEIVLNLEQQQRLGEVGTTNTAAYDLYLQGRQLLARRTSASITAAADRFQSALRLDTEYAQAYLGLADANLLLPQYNDHPGAHYLDNALKAVNHALRVNPQYGEAYATLGSVREEMGDFQGAEEAFRIALKEAPRYPTTYHWYGFMLYRTARQEEAQRMLELAIEQDPLSNLLSYGMAANLVAMGRFEEAQSRYHDIIKADPEFSWAYEGLGELNWNGYGRLAEAADWYQQAIRYDPDSSYFQSLLGAIYLDAGNVAEATRWIESALELRPDSYLTRLHAALLSLFRGDAEQANIQAFSVLADDPQNYLALAITRNFDARQATLDAALKRYEKAFPELVSGQPQLTIDTFQAAVDMAQVLTTQGAQARAALLLERAWEIARDYPSHGLPYRLSDVKILALQGTTEKALDRLEQVVDKGWRPYWWLFLKHDPALADLRGKPRFKKLVAVLENQGASAQ